MRYKLICNGVRFLKYALLLRYVNVIVHMTVGFHKMAFNYAKEEVIALRSDFIGIFNRHIKPPFCCFFNSLLYKKAAAFNLF
jgi:hypothetical protein